MYKGFFTDDDSEITGQINPGCPAPSPTGGYQLNTITTQTLTVEIEGSE